MSEVNLEELREKARTNYGITNAADLEADRLQEEMDAIDKQAKVAEKEQADITRNPSGAGANSTPNPILGAASTPPQDNTTGLGLSNTDTTGAGDEGNGEGGDEGAGENEDESVALSRQTKPQLLETAKAENVEVEDTDTVPVLREKIQAARDEAAENEDQE